MPLTAGTRLGSYEILSAIGAGGMGEVYQARDTRLNRDVALKLLPDALASDPDRLARFRREAQVLAALNHPNIGQIYGIEESPATPPALVMELVPGRTLADVIRDGPLPWEQALPIARQLAAALESAHERGIVHRDLKPANIKLRDDGTVKVLDFGLAKALETPADTGSAPGALLSPSAASVGPTITSPAMTGMGVILGTAAYMSPEQARGRSVDKRADIWAYGVVLFELLTGRRLFTGESMTDTIAAVIKEDPGLDRLPPDTPPAVRSLVARCLERDPMQRLRDIGEARILLSGSVESPSVPPPPSRAPRWWPIAIAGALALAVLSGVTTWSLKPGASLPLRRLELPMPARVVDYAISPDASRLAYISESRLYVRRFDELDPRDLGRVHITARHLTWSPDGRTLAYTAEARLQSIPADGGPTFVISQVPASGTVVGLAWLPNGNIVFSVWRDSLYTVPATGGTATVHLAVDPATEVDFHHVSALPDNRLIVATHKREEDSDVIELVDGQRRVLLTSDSTVGGFEYMAPGTLLFRRSTTNAGIWAVPFREGAIDVNGATLIQAAATDFRMARDGTVVALIPAPVKSSLVWVDPSGQETAVPGSDVESPGRDLELSPEGRRAVFVQGRRAVAGADIGSLVDAAVVVRDLETGVDTRLGGASAGAPTWIDTGSPTWFPDGRRIVHRTGRVESANLVERRADIGGSARILTPGFLGRVLADGRTLIYSRDDRGAGRIEMAPIAADGGVGPGRPLFAPESDINSGDFDVSADGRLIAFIVRQPNQRLDVFVANLADTTGHWLIQEGANRPRFTRDGRHLFYVMGSADEQGQPRGQLMRIPLKSTPTISVGQPTIVLRERPDGPRITSYDTTQDGSRFLMWKPSPPPPGQEQRLVLVQNGLAPAGR